MTFNQIASAYPDRVQMLFSKYGINKPVNGENLLSASLIYGEKFLEELADDIESNENFFIGSGKLKNAFKNAFSKAKDLIKKHSDDKNQNTGKGGKLLQIVSGLFSSRPEEDLKQLETPKKDNTKLFVFGGLGLLALIIAIVLATR